MINNIFQKRTRMVLLICVTLITAGTTMWVSNSLCRGTECLLINKLTGYKKTDAYQKTDRLYGAFFRKGQYQLRGDVWLNIDQQEADNIIKNHTIRLYTLYEMAVSPYPGEISNAITCVQKYRPIRTTDQILGIERHVFSGYANDRLAFGSCVEDLITKRAAVVMFYCGKQKQLYKLELFVPIGDPVERFDQETKRIQSLSCE